MPLALTVGTLGYSNTPQVTHLSVCSLEHRMEFHQHEISVKQVKKVLFTFLISKEVQI